jgi:HD superfamily phosphohydrolase
MYRNVYFHKVVRSAEGMVKLALQRAKRLAVQERLEWPPRESGVQRSADRAADVDQAVHGLDDVNVLHSLQAVGAIGDKILARLCPGLLYREVYKTIDLSRLNDPAARPRASRRRPRWRLSEEGRGAGVRAVLDQPSDTPYALAAAGAAEIMIRDDAAGRLIPFRDRSRR